VPSVELFTTVLDSSQALTVWQDQLADMNWVFQYYHSGCIYDPKVGA
jgi:hypothetical protein